MCATVRQTSLPSHAAIRVIFCILVVCLAAHFLVEDALLPISQSTAPNAAQAQHLNLSDADHQDDLAVLHFQPATLTDSSVPAVGAVPLPPETRPNFSILLPPKI